MDVAHRELDRPFDRLVGVAQLVIVLEVRLQPLENFDRILGRRLVDVDFLEPAHQRAVLFEILPVFLVRRGADAAQRARRERGLQQIRCVHRAARSGAGADHRVDLVDEHDRVRIGLELLDDLLQPLLEIAAIARAGQQRAHIEREDGRALQDFRHVAERDAARQPLGDRGLADARLADEQRIVLLPAAEHLDGAADLDIAPDQGIDFSVARLLVEIDAIGLERVGLLLAVVADLGVGLLVDAARGLALGHARALGDAVADVVHGVVARHVLLLQEIRGMALALGEDRDQHVGAGHLFAARGLHVDHRALDHALEAGGRLGILVGLHDQIVELAVDILDQIALELFDIDIAGAQHRSRVLIVEQGEQQVLERRVFVMALVGERQRAVQGLLEAARETGHQFDSGRVTSSPSRIVEDAGACGRSPSPA